MTQAFATMLVRHAPGERAPAEVEAWAFGALLDFHVKWCQARRDAYAHRPRTRRASYWAPIIAAAAMGSSPPSPVPSRAPWDRPSRRHR